MDGRTSEEVLRRPPRHQGKHHRSIPVPVLSMYWIAVADGVKTVAQSLGPGLTNHVDVTEATSRPLRSTDLTPFEAAVAPAPER